MKVRELALILQHVDPDMEVHISAAKGARHIARVVKAGSMRFNVDGGRYAAGVRVPSALRLDGWGPLWWDPEPEFVLQGRFRREAELLAALDPDVPTGDAS